MKLIRNFESVAAADQASDSLKSQGIVTHISSRNTKLLRSRYNSIIKLGLWAVLDHQYDDAKKYLHNNEHVVTTGISKEELVEFKTHAGPNVFQMLNKAIFYGIAIIVIMIFTMYQLAKRT